jgi:hypothetical protein
MKNFQSTTEGTWIELLQVKLTQEQTTLLSSTNEEDRVAKQELSLLLKSQKENVVSDEKSLTLTNFYNTVKPVLKETDTYELISADLLEKVEGVFIGILNCRVNGEHKQIRF